MRSNAEETGGAIDKALKNLYEAKLQMWISDIEGAKQASDAAFRSLLEIRGDFMSLKDSLDEFEKSESDIEDRSHIKLKVGEKIRENHLDTNLIFALQLYKLTSRFKKFIKESSDAGIAVQTKPIPHSSGFKYQLLDLGAERFDGRALGKFQLSRANIELLPSKISALLSQGGFTPNDTRIVDDYPHGENKALLVTLRIFVANNAVVNMTVFEDGTMVADIQSARYETARRLMETLLNALASISNQNRSYSNIRDTDE